MAFFAPDQNSAPPPDATLRFAATASEVRQALASLLTLSCLTDLGAEDRGTVELLLAEVLNNIVEHAYARWPGEIDLFLTRSATHLAIRLLDDGLEMPGATPPAGDLPEITETDDLPEGGFGWFLIRNLAEDLTYVRLAGRNQLSFSIPVNNWVD